jgi:hypothetical protein
MAYRELLALGNECALPDVLMYYQVLPYLGEDNSNAIRLIVGAKLRSTIKHHTPCCSGYVESLDFQQSYFEQYKNDLYTNASVTKQHSSYASKVGDGNYYPDFSGWKDLTDRKPLIATKIKPHFLKELATVDYRPSICRQYIGRCFESLLDQGESFICAHYLTIDMRNWLVERTLPYKKEELEKLWQPLAEIITIKREELNKHYNDPSDNQIHAGARLVTIYASQLLEQLPIPLSLVFIFTRRIYNHFLDDRFSDD